MRKWKLKEEGKGSNRLFGEKKGRGWNGSCKALVVHGRAVLVQIGLVAMEPDSAAFKVMPKTSCGKPVLSKNMLYVWEGSSGCGVEPCSKSCPLPAGMVEDVSM